MDADEASTATATVSTTYLQLLEAAGEQFAPSEWYDADRLAAALYSSLVEYGARLLEDVEDGRSEFEAWAYRVMQQQVPVVRESAGITLEDSAAEYERSVRERFGLPASLPVELPA